MYVCMCMCVHTLTQTHTHTHTHSSSDNSDMLARIIGAKLSAIKLAHSAGTIVGLFCCPSRSLLLL